MGSLPTHSKPSKLIPMRKLTATICLTFAVLLGSVGCQRSIDYSQTPILQNHKYSADAIFVDEIRSLGGKVFNYHPPPRPESPKKVEERKKRQEIAQKAAEEKLLEKQKQLSKGLVLELQVILRNFNLYEGSINGIAGRKTLLALNKWLTGNGYPPVKYISKDIISRLKIHAPQTKTARKSSPPSKSTDELEKDQNPQKLAKKAAEEKSVRS
jgi:hypothetical protein